MRFYKKNFVLDANNVLLFWPYVRWDDPIEVEPAPPFVGPMITSSIQAP